MSSDLPDANPPAAGGPCVLVVDDTPQNLQLLADLLTFKWGYRTECARTGMEANCCART